MLLPEPLNLRRAGPADAPLIAAITQAAYAKWLPILGRAPKPMTADYTVAVRDHLIDLLELGGRPVGLIELIPAEDHLLIENLAVDPAYQGRRLGQHLLTHAEQLTRSHGLSELRLYTNKLFTVNIEFYLARGFRVTGEEPFRGGTVVHMSKALAGSTAA
jgi:ribosomal protein S18 acetylase RimI-like enzyme